MKQVNSNKQCELSIITKMKLHHFYLTFLGPAVDEAKVFQKFALTYIHVNMSIIFLLSIKYNYVHYFVAIGNY